MRCAYSAFSRAVVKLPDEPKPVPAGISASVVISNLRRLELRKLDRLSNDRMMHFAGRLDVLKLRILEEDARRKRPHHSHIDVPVDGGGNEESLVLPVIGRQIRAAAAQT